MDASWVFFDIGSTLVDETDFNSHFLGYVYETLERAGANVAKEAFDDCLRTVIAERKFDAGGYRTIIKALVKNFSNDEVILLHILDHYRDFGIKKYVESMTPFPDTIEVLNSLKGKYKLGIIANQPLGTRKRIETLGLTSYFDVIALSEELQLRKPDIRIFLYALRISGCNPKEAVMIGDRLDADIGPAKSLGMTTVRIKKGIMNVQYPLNSHEIPDYEVESLKQILSIL